jgi:hypothetical protein
MGNETQLSPDRLNGGNLAADALELARRMPPGHERNEALKLAACFVVRPMRGDWFSRNGAGHQSKAEPPK